MLLIACVNLTNLVWARAIARRREVGVRVAIGATRVRIVRQFLAEGAVLATIGGVAGLFLGWILLHTASALPPESDVFFRTSMAPGLARTTGAAGLTRIGASMIGLDAATLTFTCAVAMFTAILVSLLPAVQASMLGPIEAMKAGGKGMGGTSVHALNARAVLVSLQIALALILMAGAGLMLRSAARLSGTDIGAATNRVLTVRLDLPRAHYTDATGPVLYRELIDRVRAVPGIESVALGNCAPVSGGCNGTSIWFPPQPRLGSGRDPVIGIYWATPEYFTTLGISLLRGRTFTERDRAGQPRVVLVNEAAARAFWPNDSPLGKIVSGGQAGLQESAEVVGVVSNTRYGSPDSSPIPDVYVPAAQSFQPRMRLFVRSSLDTRTLVTTISRQVRELDPNLPLSEIKSMEERLGDAMWRTRVGAWLLSAFAALALFLTTIGVFGVMAQTVLQRTAEIGIRLALGAQRRDVLALVLRRAALVTASGLVIGVSSALGITRLMATLLYDVQPYDPLTYISVAVVLGAVALIACYVPARRATRVDAVVALRAE